MGSAAGPLVGANIDTAAVTVRVNTPRSIVHFPTPLAHDPDLPNPGGEGDGTEWAVTPGEACVHSVNSFVAFSVGQRDLRSSVKSSCSVTVPVSIPSVAVSVHSFSPLAPASQVSPLRLDQFQTELQHHPDRAAVAYVLSGLREGFRIGFESSMVNLKSASSNMRSSFEHPFVIDSYLQTEVSSGRVAGPFSAPPFPSLHISRFGVIPKNNQPGKWRLILDLSSPVGHSVNDGIPKPPFTVQYVSVDAVIEGIMARGRGTLMAKFDVASATGMWLSIPTIAPCWGCNSVGSTLSIWFSRLGCVQRLLFSLLLRTRLNGSWFIIMVWTSYVTTWMTFLPLVHRHPHSATSIYLPVFAFARGLASPFILTR